MESGNHTLQGNLVSKIYTTIFNGNHSNGIWQVTGNFEKWQHDMGRTMKSKKLNEKL